MVKEILDFPIPKELGASLSEEDLFIDVRYDIKNKKKVVFLSIFEGTPALKLWYTLFSNKAKAHDIVFFSVNGLISIYM